MITPDEIRTKANRLYPKAIQAWLAGEEFFPHTLRSSKTLSNDTIQDRNSTQALRSGSKEVLGYGYAVDWVERRTKASGRNDVPVRILFETEADLLQLIGKQDEFASLQSAVAKIRQRLPELEPWLRSRTKILISHAERIDDLIPVTEWFRRNPWPECFAREIPVDVETKFIEDHQKILQEWFDVEGIMPASGIRSDEKQFFRRYGLRDKEPFVLLRYLDATIRQQHGFPCDELRIPLSTLANMDVANSNVFVVENEMNVRTFPRKPNSIVLFGSGNAAVSLRDLTWLNDNNVFYWGDIDVDGFEILNRFRRLFPKTRSLLMDADTLETLTPFTGQGNHRQPESPALLNVGEATAFRQCSTHNLRLEQERIPQPIVVKAVDSCLADDYEQK